MEAELIRALRKIADWEYRSDRRKRYMVDVFEVQQLKRIARVALRNAVTMKGKNHV